MLTPNTLIQNRYRIVRHIAGGGMGSVYEAVDERLGHAVALKHLVLTDALAQQAFEREAKILAPLRHATLPTVSDYFHDPAGRFLVMQYIPGDDLGAQLAQRGHAFPAVQVLAWADQLLKGLDYLHSRGIIHRDIKPQNLKLTDEGDIILLDFGIAKNATRGSMRAATPEFAPLEQMQGQGTDARSDLYALGATLYCLLTNRTPEDSITRLVAASRHQPDPVLPLHTLNPQVAQSSSAVIMQALALHPDDRPTSAAALRQMLAAAQNPQPAVLPFTVLVPDPPAPPKQPQPTRQPPPQQPALMGASPRKSNLVQYIRIGGVLLLLTLVAVLLIPRLLNPAPSSPLPALLVPELIEIPAGPFLMGSHNDNLRVDDNEMLQHERTLDTYWIGKTEVTNAQFRPFVEGDGYTNPDYWTIDGWQWREENGITKPTYWDYADWNSDLQPVVGISWFEAVAYCRWLSTQTGHNFRLPTEAEWEKAARGPDGRIWPWGNVWLAGHANSVEAGVNKTLPVGRYPDGASFYGVLDMAGNAWEWTTTQWYNAYPDPLEGEWSGNYLAGNDLRVVRSGGWNWAQQYVRGAYRHQGVDPFYRNDYLGLRLASNSLPPGSNDNSSAE